MYLTAEQIELTETIKIEAEDPVTGKTRTLEYTIPFAVARRIHLLQDYWLKERINARDAEGMIPR